MTDGTKYVDTDKNGKPDLMMKVDSMNQIWQNEGSGWTQTGFIRGYCAVA